jgi:type IX secretion system PorP/SprF family membrane protein
MKSKIMWLRSQCRWIVLVLFSMQGNLAFAQDWHFSQFQGNPLAIDPAMAGLFSGDLRVGLQYRNQWNFAANFHTISAAADAPLFRFKNEDYFAGSLQVISDQAGDLRFRTTALHAGLAYHKRLDPYRNHYLSAGYQAGYALRAVDYSGIVAFDPEPAAVLENNQFGFLDMAAGVNWFLAPKRNRFAYAGMGLHHLNQPDQSFQQDGSAPLSMRLNLYAGGSFPLSRSLFLQPAMVVYNQGPHQELNAGVNLRWWLNEEQSIYQQERALGMGVWYRAADALIVSTRIDYGDFVIGLSYDINFSKLSQVSNLNGGPEVSLVYILNNGKDAGGSLRQQMYCPSFF